MYLLMLLATFLSAIYGYNLSIRPDYDRDIPHKKALAVAYKFSHQHSAAKKVMFDVAGGGHTSEGMPWILPGDTLYEKTANANKSILTYKQGATTLDVPVRKVKNNVGDFEGSNILHIGRTLYPGDVMVSQVVCPSKEIDENDVSRHCEPQTAPDGSGDVIGTCCFKGGVSPYLISYRVMDARWLNRLTNNINSDFMWALNKRNFAENIGSITWNGTAWEFNGRIRLYAVYRKDKIAFEEAHNGMENFPVDKMNRTHWVMPSGVFTRDFFKDANGRNMCDNGCLVKIEEL